MVYVYGCFVLGCVGARMNVHVPRGVDCWW